MAHRSRVADYNDRLMITASLEKLRPYRWHCSVVYKELAHMTGDVSSRLSRINEHSALGGLPVRQHTTVPMSVLKLVKLCLISLIQYSRLKYLRYMLLVHVCIVPYASSLISCSDALTRLNKLGANNIYIYIFFNIKVFKRLKLNKYVNKNVKIR